MIALQSLIQGSIDCSLYSVVREQRSNQTGEFVVSTPETREICNDPFVVGMNYTDRLRKASGRVLRQLRDARVFSGSEHSTQVLTILRGGLNFQLREALSDAFGWSAHSSWFISAQRRLRSPDSSEWEIVEDSYTKMHQQPEVDIVFGDIVATGTSLRHGLEKIRGQLGKSMRCRSLMFFTIGGAVSGDYIDLWRAEIHKALGQEVSCSVVYFEGVFGVAHAGSSVRIKIDGTDLLRRDGAMSPEFLASQYENPSFPLERCTIYDAGSRAFHVLEYLEDVREYWELVSEQAAEGISFSQLVEERCPEINPTRFGKVDLHEIATRQLERAGGWLQTLQRGEIRS